MEGYEILKALLRNFLNTYKENIVKIEVLYLKVLKSNFVFKKCVLDLLLTKHLEKFDQNCNQISKTCDKRHRGTLGEHK